MNCEKCEVMEYLRDIEEENENLEEQNRQLIETIKNMGEDPRTCDVCGRDMVSGYCVGDGEEYYCSDKCLGTVYTAEEYCEMYNNDQAYWTEWECVKKEEKDD